MSSKKALRILLTGGSGDLGSLLSLSLLQQGDVPVVIDMATPKVAGVEFFQGSILVFFLTIFF